MQSYMKEKTPEPIFIGTGVFYEKLISIIPEGRQQLMLYQLHFLRI